jgi:hypothetical protein
VSSKTVPQGGYHISYETDDGGKRDTQIPDPYQVLLGPDQLNALDVSDRPRHDLLDAAKLGELLGIIDKRNAWGNTMFVKLFVILERQLIQSSDAAILRCPIEPYSGKMLSTVENADLLYEGDPKTDSFWGRMFYTAPGFDKYLFVWGGRLELEPAKRGFDCITYAGTTCGAKHTDMGGSGATLADALHATPVVHDKVTLDKASKEHLTSFFEKNKAGYYLMYSTGHVTLVVDGCVYEFKPNQPGNKGFVPTPTSDWVTTHLGGWTLRKLASKPPLASA